jgi:hypothetical protein
MDRISAMAERVAGLLDESSLPDGLPGSQREHGFPGPFERERLFDGIRPGSRVTIVTPHGSRLTGRAVMRGPAGWVLNLGGRHGTPGIASDDNVIAVRASRTAADRSAMDAFAEGMEAVAFVAEAVVNDFVKVSSNPDQYEVDVHVYLDAKAARPSGFTQMVRREARRVAEEVGARVVGFWSPRMDRDVGRGGDLARFYEENPYKVTILCAG